MYTFDQGEVIEVHTLIAILAAHVVQSIMQRLLKRQPQHCAHRLGACLTSAFGACIGIPQVMGYDLVVRDRRQDILHRSNHGNAEFETCGMHSDPWKLDSAEDLISSPASFMRFLCMHDMIVSHAQHRSLRVRLELWQP